MKKWLEFQLMRNKMSKAEFARRYGESYADEPSKGGYRLVAINLVSKSVKFNQIMKACQILKVSIVEYEVEFLKLHGNN